MPVGSGNKSESYQLEHPIYIYGKKSGDSSTITDKTLNKEVGGKAGHC
jgi:hypothetical protein